MHKKAGYTMRYESDIKRDESASKSSFYRKSLGFRSRFLIGTGMALMLFCFAGAYFFYEREKNQMEKHAYEKTMMVMAAVEASRKYVRDELRPRMIKEFGSDYFNVQAMSTSYVGRAVMENFNHVLSDYEYRRVAQNARNPNSEANSLELSMIHYFQDNPEHQNWQGVMNVGGQKQFMRFKPVYFEESCMTCHGNPLDAPRDLIALYGPEKGFGKTSGDLAGVMAVGIPVQKALAEIKDQAASVFFSLFLGALVFYLTLAFIFNRAVVNNLRGVISIFKEEVEEKSLQDFLPKARPGENMDELEELTETAVVMSEHLRNTKLELQKYALNLEQTVAQRTKALQESENLLQQKVLARKQELQTLNALAELTTQAVALSEILPQVQQRTLQVFPAKGSGIYLYDETKDGLFLQYQENAPSLQVVIPLNPQNDPDEDIQPASMCDSIARAAFGQPSFYDCQENSGCLNIPLYCRGKILGVMSFVGVDYFQITSEQKELLLSIGRQIGIAVESIQNMGKLLQSKELLQSVFDGITDQVVLMDKDFRIKMVNKAYTARYNVEMEEVIGLRCYEIHGSGEGPCSDCGLQEVMKTGKPVVQESTCPEPHGIFQVHCYPNLDEEGRVESIIRFVKEITAQKQMEQQIQQTEKMVAMGQLAAGVAHEINNPLGVILCYSELLKRQLTDSAQVQKDLTVIEKQARNCKSIVSDLLNFARSRETTKQPTSVNQTLDEVLGIVTEQFKKQGVKVDLELDPDLPLLNMDVNKMKQVFLNLLMNARQATDAREGRLLITTSHLPEEKSIRITFWDNGQGIPEYIQDRIFDPFFSTKRTGEGTGLGLSVSYGIIQNHGGDITVRSEPGKWTEFQIQLPLSETLDKV